MTVNLSYYSRHDFYTALISGAVFPLHELIKGHNTVSVRNWLERTQYLSRDDLLELQAKRLKTLIEQSVMYVPYYRNLFSDLDLVPGDIQKIDDLAKLPFLTKAVIRKHEDELKKTTGKKLVKGMTSGSTGEPLRFWLGKERITHDIAAKWRAQRWWGVDIGDPELVIWAAPTSAGWSRMLQRRRDNFFRSTVVNVTDFSVEILDEILSVINRKRPRIIFGYTAAIARLAKHILFRGRHLNNPNMQVVFVTSEKLLEEQRTDIENAFGCGVANEYGARDAGYIAHECPQGGMHLTMEDVIVEIVNEEGCSVAPGHPGQVVITNLASGDFPLIRYCTGDVAILQDEICSCGRGLMLLKDIQGRSNDFLLTTEGDRLHYTSITHTLRGIPNLHSFKVIQESMDFVRILVEVEGQMHIDDSVKIETKVKKRLGENMKVVVEEVDTIPLEKSGKHRHIVNRVLEQGGH
ncbi:MAG: phenylacetate--CoA ligase family protein [Gammaproteobacteria bacterium]|nr:phenylacetate--CoA ligase family protein [Gammaproteobacteria bacterium]